MISLKLGQDARKTKTVRECIDFAFSFQLTLLNLKVSITPVQQRDEIQRLITYLVKKKPRVMLEIGTANGGTLFLFCRTTDPEGLIISLDLPGGEFGGGYNPWRMSLYRSFAQPKQRIHFISGDSHSSETFETVQSILRGNKIDFLFIDGDHTYEGVKRDFELFSRLVESKGMIAFHDIVPHPPELNVGVPDFWREVKREFRNAEFVTDWNQKWGGIGVLFV